jgi:hypothetical protein
MNAERFSMSEPTAHLGRIAILWRGDEAARRSAMPETSRSLSAWKIIADGRIAIAQRGPRDVAGWSMVGCVGGGG